MRKILIILFVSCSFYPLWSGNSWQVPFFESRPCIDGNGDDMVWGEALLLDEFYQTAPGDNTEPSSETLFRMGYDHENLYFLVQCFSNDHGTIRDFHCSRDKIYTTDRVFIFLDTFHSDQKAYYLGCNLNGEQADGIVQQDIDTTIDFYYRSAGRRTDYGFLLELALPFKSINYRSGKNVTWGFFIKRHIPAFNEEITSQPVRRGGGNYFDNYGEIHFDYLPSKLNLKIIPAVITDFKSFEDELNDFTEEDYRIEPELNLFLEPGSMITTTLTYNPDFNIIEADALEIEVNNRYAIYYPEKRPFFIEASNPYNTPIDIFYTRKIVDPKLGIKLSGTFGNKSLYVLGALDEDVPGEFFDQDFDGKKDVPFAFGAFSWKTGHKDDRLRMATSLRRYGKYDNYALNFDNNFRLNQEIDFSSQLTYSATELFKEEDNEIVSGYGYSSQLNYYNGTWYIHNFAKGISEDYRADLGFITETDINFLENRIEYQKHSETDKDLIRYMEVASTQTIKYDFSFEDIKHFYWEGMGGIFFNNKFEFWTGLEYMMENYKKKDFYLYYPWLSLEYDTYGKTGAKILAVAGRNIWFGGEKGETGTYRKVETSLYLRPLNAVDIELQHKYHETMDYYIARTYEFKTKLQFQQNFWFRLILQLRNNDIFILDEAERRFEVYPLFVYKPSANSALYLGASRGENEVYENKLKEMADSSITYFLKMSYTIEIF